MRQTEGGDDDRLISATEIASWAYCPEQWRLRHGLGYPSGNHKQLAAGVRHHAEKAAAEMLAGHSLRWGRLLMTLAVAVLLCWLWWR